MKRDRVLTLPGLWMFFRWSGASVMACIDKETDELDVELVYDEQDQ